MKKKNMIVVIDGENIPAREAEKIFSIVNAVGVIDYAKVYGIQKDRSTRAWTLVSKADKNLKDIRLYGGPAKDKVDKKIIKDLLEEISLHKNVDIVVLVSCDHGYAPCIKELRKQGKRVVVIGYKKTAKILREVCSEYHCLCS